MEGLWCKVQKQSLNLLIRVWGTGSFLTCVAHTRQGECMNDWFPKSQTIVFSSPRLLYFPSFYNISLSTSIFHSCRDAFPYKASRVELSLCQASKQARPDFLTLVSWTAPWQFTLTNRFNPCIFYTTFAYIFHIRIKLKLAMRFIRNLIVIRLLHNYLNSLIRMF